MTATPLNPIHFFVLPLAVSHEEETPINLCDSGYAYTFNLENKNGVVKQPKKYYHKLLLNADNVLDFNLGIGITATDYRVDVYNSSGINITSSDPLTQVGTTTHYTCTIGSSILTPLVGQRIFFVLQNITTDEVLALSDLVDVIAATTNKIVALTVQNSRTYADADPSLAFTILLRAAFVRPNEPEDIEASSYANGTPVLLSTTVKSQTLLKVLPMPGYMHKKLKLALKCSSVQINGYTWVQEEAYNQEWQSEDTEFAWGRVFLTLVGGTYRNVIA